MIRKTETGFVLETKNTSYLFRVMETGHLEHLYYGRKIRVEQIDSLVEKQAFAPGDTICYDEDHPSLSLEDVCLEMSSGGKGDSREPFIELIQNNGCETSDFLFQKAEISKGKIEEGPLPGSYDETDQVDHLCITLEDHTYEQVLELHYYVFEDCDVITRSARLINESTSPVTILRLMSSQTDFDETGLVMTSFHGAWATEMNRVDIQVQGGMVVNSSYTGTSSSRANPFIMISRPETNQDYGNCYGYHLVYSGNHYEGAEVSSFGKTRVVTGIQPRNFRYRLNPGETFYAPEAVMSFSSDGFNGLSGHLHQFIREHIVRGTWKEKIRPVLLNSWEASYFDIDEKKLLNLAKAGKQVGIELFVMDDGWFGNRDNDTQGLGDWEPNPKKLPGGIEGIARKVKELGMDFGIWVEPEMVNVNSNLYRQHPDWAMDVPGQSHSEGRHQRVLDLTRQDVQDDLIEKMTRVFSTEGISYVKWDMNRNLTDYFSKALAGEQQGEVSYRYVTGLYRCMKELTSRFPHILFEGCAGGGNRFDLGILCYFPQIWASDNTDAYCRTRIQEGYSYGYPLSTVTAHVSSCPNHQTLRVTPLETRFSVACFGLLGYECNLCDMKKEELEQIKQQISLYKEWRETLQKGSFYRGSENENEITWTCVSRDQSKAVGMTMQKLAEANQRYHKYQPKGLKPDSCYHFYNREMKYDIREFGDLVNTVSPVHVKQNSLMHNMIAKFVKMEGEKEDYLVYGDALMYGGVKLTQSFAGTGFNNQVRYYQDFGARLYLMEETHSIH